ncbi:MAG: ethanolamine ammonia-lyase light chain EutC [Methylococcales bacterium]|nr:ethanolamine ammonia-lyase light chain EutC [Methylococcales bacterium]
MHTLGGFTFQAQAGISTDADRNCISNIHHHGLSYQLALKKLLFLIAEAENLGYSGCLLKDETQAGSGDGVLIEG